MNIDAIELFRIALPYRQPLRTPLGPREKLETVLVALHGGGATGWGEASPGSAPLNGPEWAAGAFAVIRDWLAPVVVGETFSTGEEISKRLNMFQGNQFAKAAIDSAWWDLQSRLQNKPLHQLLNGQRSAIEVGPTFDQMESSQDFRDQIAAAADAGFARVKLKFRPGWDVQMVDFVRKEFPLLTLQIDCEGSLGLQHMEMLYRLDDFSLAMTEQPLSAYDLVGHAMVQDSVRTPICLDESIFNLAQAEMALELHSCKFINLKPSRVGGVTTALAIHDLCKSNQVPCWIGAMPQSAVGARIGFALAAKENCTYPSDYYPSEQLLAGDVAEPLSPSRDESDGRQRVKLWTEPGIGIVPERKILEQFCITQLRIGK